jgi:hypothetical protein
LREQFNRSDFLRRLMLLYMQALLTQIAQTAACNRHHSLNKQLCRWLADRDRPYAVEPVQVTQQLIADMLGVRREGVTEAAGKLHDAGLIHHSRGCIKVLDREGLEARACECYGIVKREFDRLLPRCAPDRDEVLLKAKTKNPAGSRLYGVSRTSSDYLLVPKRGLEPPHLAAHGPEPCASTNSATWANRYNQDCYFSERFEAVNGRARNRSKGEGKQGRSSRLIVMPHEKPIEFTLLRPLTRKDLDVLGDTHHAHR